MSKLLHIETSTKVTSVAISENGQLVDVMEEGSDGYIHSEKLTTFIAEVCKKNNWSFKDLDAIVVTSGPGSYTGLRVGVSTAKGLCFALDLPLISVNALESIAYIANEQYPSKNICAMIDARRMEAFACVFDAQLNVLKPLSADELTGISYEEFEPFVACGNGADKVKELWSNRNVIVDETIVSSARGQVKLAYQKFVSGDFEDVAYFEPKYLKDFVAALPKNKRPF